MTVKLGSMQLPKGYKFIQELIIEGIWPFSRLKSPYNFLLLSIAYFLAGAGLYFLHDLPLSFFIAGSFAGIGISVWTYGIFQYADRLRNAEITRMTSVKRKFLGDFLEDMFHHRSLFFGVMGFAVTLSYFWTSKDFFHVDNIFDNLRNQIGVPLHPFLLLYAFIIAFDVCYRFGLSGYISLVLLKRNYIAGRLLRDPKLKTQITPRDLLELERVDRFHLLSFASGLLFLPLSLFDPVLTVALILYLLLSSLATIVSILQLKTLQAKAIPTKVLNLLGSCRFAYMGISTDSKIPHVTPILFVFDGRKLFIATSIKSIKVKSLYRHKNVAVCLHHESPEDPCKNLGVLIRGRSRIYGHNTLTAIFYVLIYGVRMFYVKMLYHRKYPEYVRYYQFKSELLPGPWRMRPILSRTIIEISVHQYTYWEGTRFVKTAAI
ncbi:MAG: pyridoxamine 5'-phosphate oxidase family protein [Candidatus Odinarchaeota archaeon]